MIHGYYHYRYRPPVPKKRWLGSLDPEIAMVLSSNIAASGEATTQQMTPPAGKAAGDFDAGRIQDDENPADTIDITLDDYTEMEWCIEATANVATSQVFEFRVIKTEGHTLLDTYTVTPQWTIGTPAATQVKMEGMRIYRDW